MSSCVPLLFIAPVTQSVPGAIEASVRVYNHTWLGLSAEWGKWLCNAHVCQCFALLSTLSHVCQCVVALEFADEVVTQGGV